VQLPELPDARMLTRRLMDSPPNPGLHFTRFCAQAANRKKNAAARIIAKARGARQCDSRESV